MEERDESGREGVAGCRGVQLGRQGRRRLVLEIVAGLEIWVRRSVREDLLLRMVRHGGILRFVVDGASDGLVCGLESEGSISFDSAIHERVLLDCRLILLLLRILQAQIRLTLREGKCVSSPGVDLTTNEPFSPRRADCSA